MTIPQTERRTYEETHPWLDFRLDLSRADTAFWMLLGESRSKVEHIAGALLRPDVARELHEVFLAKGALATTAIEGNTLSEAEVRGIVEGRLKLPPSRKYLQREVENVIAAYNGITGALLRGEPEPLSVALIAEYNRQILEGLELEEGVVPGEVPDRPPVVGRYKAAPREDCEFLLEKLCDWLNNRLVQDAEERRIPFAVLRAIAAHLYMAWIHPFGDGNGRTARLIELKILVEAGVPSPAGHLLSNHYNQTRNDYYRHLDRASRSENGVIDFFRYALEGFVEGLRGQLALIRDQQFKDRWEQYIYESFAGRTSKANHRRRELTLSLSKADGPVPRGEIRMLSPALAEAYADKTDRTVSRDLNALTEMGLVQREGDGYSPNRRVIEAFLPLVAEA